MWLFLGRGCPTLLSDETIDRYAKLVRGVETVVSLIDPEKVEHVAITVEDTAHFLVGMAESWTAFAKRHIEAGADATAFPDISSEDMMRILQASGSLIEVDDQTYKVRAALLETHNKRSANSDGNDGGQGLYFARG